MADTAREPNNLSAHTMADALAQLAHELEQGRAQAADRRLRRQAALREVKSARGIASDLSWELADIEQRLRDLQEQREGPGDLLLERELTSVATQRTALEERVLAQLLLVDELAARAAEEERALSEEDQSWAAREAALLAEQERISRLLATPSR